MLSENAALHMTLAGYDTELHTGRDVQSGSCKIWHNHDIIM